MRLFTLFALLLYVACSAHASNLTLEAAEKHVQGVKWCQASVVFGDFSCRGVQEQAILGTTKTHIVVAIFIDGLAKPPEVLRFSAADRSATTVVLTTERMDFDLKEFKDKMGYIPSGMRSAKHCKGLNLSDGYVDSIHIYWDHDAKRFSDWGL